MRLTSPTSPRSSFGSSSNSSSRIASRHPITSSSSSSSSSSRRSSYALSTYKIWTSIPTIFVLPIPFLALLVSYLWAVGRRPEIPEQARIDDPHQWGYPNWYGRHPSPYDHGVKLNREDEEVCEHPKKVMLFIDLQPDSPEIPKALTALSSLSTSPRFNLTGVISPFSPNWVQDDSALNNLVRNGCEDVDWIWRIGGDRGRIGKTTTLGGDEPEYIDDFDSDGDGASGGEGEEGTRISGSEKRRACGNASWVQDGETEGAALGSMDVTLLAQPHDMLKPEASHHALKANHGDTWEMGLFGHVMPAANPEIFYPSQNVKSPNSIMYFPSRSTPSRDYPRLPWGRQWSIYAASRKNVPRLKKGEDPFSGVVADKKKPSKWVKYWMKEEERLAKAMRHAGICLFEGWDKGIAVDRVVKAMLSGCVVATVPPHTLHDVFAPVILPLSRPIPNPTPSSSIPDLPVDQIRALLHQQQYTIPDLRRIALKAFMLARHRLIPPARLDNVEKIAKVWEEGGRGYHFGDGFRWDCHSRSGSSTGGGWCGEM